jgi:hypothetical protein
MATAILRGGLMNLVVPQSVNWSPVVSYKGSDGNLVTTIASATYAIAEGSISNPGADFLQPTVTVTAGTYLRFTVTQAEFDTFTPGRSYCHSLVVTLADGSLRELFQGSIFVKKKVPL